MAEAEVGQIYGHFGVSSKQHHHLSPKGLFFTFYGESALSKHIAANLFELHTQPTGRGVLSVY